MSVQATTANYTTAQTDTILLAIAPGMRYMLCGLNVCYSKDGTVAALNALIKIGSTTVWRHPGMAPGGDSSSSGGGTAIHIGADGEDVTVTCGAPTDASVQFTIFGIQVPTDNPIRVTGPLQMMVD